MKQVVFMINSPEHTVDQHHHIVVKLPQPCAHTGHVLSAQAAVSNRMHPAVKEKLYSYVALGITSTPMMRRLLTQYVQEDLSRQEPVGINKEDRAYFPTSRDIRNHIHSALVAGQYSGLDEDNLQHKVGEWKKNDPSASFFLRPCTEQKTACKERVQQAKEDRGVTVSGHEGDSELSTSHQFLFIHQNGAQKRLLNRYGDIALLDATYRTTKYSLPLFMLVVRTNVGYLTAAEFICEVETAESIKEALHIISTWNPEWTPSHWMVDYSDAEYQAIQHVFPRAKIYLCTFHREQAWMRWVRDGRYTVVR